MSAPVLLAADLLPNISQAELDGLAAQLLELGQADPIATGIAEELQTIAMYVEPWLIKPEFRTKIWRLLVISGLYNRLSRLPDKRKEEREWALAVLKDIRDGKFPNLVLDPDVTLPEASGGAWGSAERTNFGTLLATSTGGSDE